MYFCYNMDTRVIRGHSINKRTNKCEQRNTDNSQKNITSSRKRTGNFVSQFLAIIEKKESHSLYIS